MSLRDFLVSQGISEPEIEEAEAQGIQGLQMLAIDRLLLPGRNRYTPPEIAARAGVDRDVARRYWRALGFVDLRDDEAAFTDLDLAALRDVLGLIERGYANPESTLQLTRVMGQALSRVADAQVSVVRDRIEQPLREAGTSNADLAEAIVVDVERLLPVMEGFLSFAYRRHLAAAAKRSTVADVTPAGGLAMSVGFCDLVGFTAMARRLEESELGHLVERFETTAYDVVGSNGGRVIKMIGDEVMFVAEDPAAVAEIGLSLSEVHAGDRTLPDVRVGLAYGPVLPREGDYFGETVNLANRVAAVALPRTVLVSEPLAEALQDAPGIELRRLRNRYLKGVGRVRLWALRRADE